MSLFADLFRKGRKSESIVLVDIGADSVAGAYVRYVEGELPTVLYTRRLPVEVRESEPRERAMLRALRILADTLIREGGPILARESGSGKSDSILVSINAPWQKTSVRTEHVEQEEPFTFTRGLVAAILEKTAIKIPGKRLVDESIIGTILNGYETRSPYGKRAHRAAIIILTSLVDEPIAKEITSTLQSVYHSTRILPIAGGSLRYQAIQRAFPHERDALILDATGPLTSIALVRRGLFVDVVEVPADTPHAWVQSVASTLAELAKRYPLPRAIFLLAHEPEAPPLQKKLDAANLGKLWLSDNPPKIVSVLASHIIGLVRQTTTASPDLLLLLMALYYQAREKGEKS